MSKIRFDRDHFEAVLADFVEENPLACQGILSVAIGWAGYDAATRYISPEHFLAHRLREALDNACAHGGKLEGHGPDGKLVVQIDESPPLRGQPAVWHIPTSRSLSVRRPVATASIRSSMRASARGSVPCFPASPSSAPRVASSRASRKRC